MTPRGALALGATLGLGAGLLGGYLIQRRLDEAPHVAVLWRVGRDVFVDQRFLDWLAADIPPRTRGEWTSFEHSKVAIHLLSISDRRLLPGQLGPLFQIRDLHDDANDADVEVLLAWLVRLGVVHEAGTWLTWDQATAALNP